MYKLLIPLSIFLFACNSSTSTANTEPQEKPLPQNATNTKINFDATTLENRFNPPKNFERQSANATTIDFYLRNLPLKKWGSKVLYYNGQEKTKPNVYISVVDMPISNKDLHQCADAVMNLYANYLYSQKRYNEIQFKFLHDDAWHNFAKWSGGNYSKQNFTNYMEQIFAAANTKSLFGQLKSIKKDDAKIGDVLIQTGNPYGHAIMIVDECVNKQTGKKLYLLAQSYMPAQETQILINPNNTAISPWFSFDESIDINTPEWLFTTNDFRRF